MPAGYDAALRDGGRAEVQVIGLPTTALSALRRAVDTAVAEQAARVRAARLVQAEAGIPFDEALGIATDVQAGTPGIEVTVERIGEGIFPEGTAAFAPGAQSQLVLFMFLTSMTAATQIILSRQLGVSRRMLAAPIGVTTIVVGEVLGRFGVAMVQGLFIVFLSALAFGVPWGDPLAAGMVVVVVRPGRDRRGDGRRASSRTTWTRPARSASWPGCCSAPWAARWCRSRSSPSRCTRSPT